MKFRVLCSTTVILPLLFILITVLVPPPVIAQADARAVISRMEKKLRGKSSRARMMIRIKRPRYTRTMVLDSWEVKKNKRSFIRILRPRKDRGIAFLKWGVNLWQYIPRIGREIKIEGSLMHDSWMGSDFTNDDLVRASSILDDYNHRLASSPEPGVYRVELIPKPNAPVSWSKVVADVRKKDFMPLRQMFYDHRGRLRKQMEFSHFRRMGGRLIPTRYVMYSIRRGVKRSSTEMRFLKVRFDLHIPAGIFSKSNLRRRR